MNTMMLDLRSRFDELERREQIALLTMSAFLAVVFLYFVIWSPANSYLADGRLNHERHLKILHYLQSTEAEAKAASKGSGKSKLTGQSMLTAVSRTAQNVGIKPSRMQPEGDSGVSVWFDSVAFTQLMLCLERLESRHGVVIKQISIDRRDDPGQVSVRLVLR